MTKLVPLAVAATALYLSGVHGSSAQDTASNNPVRANSTFNELLAPAQTPMAARLEKEPRELFAEILPGEWIDVELDKEHADGLRAETFSDDLTSSCKTPEIKIEAPSDLYSPFGAHNAPAGQDRAYRSEYRWPKDKQFIQIASADAYAQYNLDKAQLAAGQAGDYVTRVTTEGGLVELEITPETNNVLLVNDKTENNQSVWFRCPSSDQANAAAEYVKAYAKIYADTDLLRHPMPGPMPILGELTSGTWTTMMDAMTGNEPVAESCEQSVRTEFRQEQPPLPILTAYTTFRPAPGKKPEKDFELRFLDGGKVLRLSAQPAVNQITKEALVEKSTELNKQSAPSITMDDARTRLSKGLSADITISRFTRYAPGVLREQQKMLDGSTPDAGEFLVNQLWIRCPDAASK